MNLEKLLAGLLRYDRWLLWIGIPLLTAVLHGAVWKLEPTGPHVWRQTQTLQTVDSFVEEDFCILNPRHLERGSGDGIARLEFPLYQWVVAAFGKIVGNTVLLSRLLSFLIACCAVWGLHALVLAWSGDRLQALIAAYAMYFSPVVYYYSVTPLPDMLALAVGVWSLAMLMRAQGLNATKWWACGMALAGLATLLKLPYAVFVTGALLAAILQWRREDYSLRLLLKLVALIAICCLPAAAWYAWVMPTWGSSGATGGLFTASWEGVDWRAIVSYQITQMYPRTLMSIVFLPIFLWGCLQLWRGARATRDRDRAWLLLAVCAAMLLFSIYELRVISTFHDYYLLPMVPFLAIAIAAGGSHLLQQRRWALVGWMALILLLGAPLMTYRRIHPRWQPDQAEFNRDLAIYQSALRVAVPDDALVVAGPDVSHNIFLYYIHKKGWTWDANQPLDASKLQAWRDAGAKYFYCDDRNVDGHPAIQALLGPPIGSWGTVRVYALIP